MVFYASDSQQADNFVDLLPGVLDQLDRVDRIQMEAPESRQFAQRRSIDLLTAQQHTMK